MGRVTDGHVHEMAWPLPMLTGLLPSLAASLAAPVGGLPSGMFNVPRLVKW